MSSRLGATRSGTSPAMPRKSGTKSASGRLKTATVSARAPAPRSNDSPKKAVSRDKVTKHEDRKVAKRNAALNAMGGMKVDVFVRVRPPMEREKNDTVNINVKNDSNEIILKDKENNEQKFKYDQVFDPSSTQEEIFSTAVSPIIEQVVRGLSCAIFAYGQTGSGKTHTMRGHGSDPSQHGVIQRSLEMLLRRLPEQEYTDISMSVSFLEVYNEELMDMFRPQNDARLTLVDDDTRGTVCHGLTEIPVTGVQEVLSMLDEADKLTKVSETKMNKYSNRAHRIFTIIAKFKRYDSEVVSTLTFVDLAGSEDISRSGATGLTAREAAHINKSLLTLGRVINALAQSEKHIPYRDSKLTRLLSEALGGMCKTTFIACVSPVITSFTESQSTLRYAERAMEALNISQLPRWKQQEIIIDHLNRRLLAFEEEIAAQNRLHKEDIAKMAAKNDELEAARKLLAIQNFKLQKKVEKLTIRKSKLKAGLAAMTAERDMMHDQKEALRAELLQCRRERDGYLADRTSLFDVLGKVRIMRENLLEAHRDTEGLLTDDCKQLKSVLEMAIVDISDLHTEVARKKEMSAHNEKVADDYRERMSTRLRDIIQTVVDFQHTNEQQHESITDGLLDLRNQDQTDCAANGLQLAALSSKASDMLKEITDHCSNTEDALAAQIARRGTDVEQFSANISTTMAKFKGAVASQLDKLRAEAAELDGQMSTWAANVSSKITAREASVKDFSSQLAKSLAGMDAAVASASADHLQHLVSHRQQLSGHYVAEKAAMENDSAKLISNLNDYIARMVSEFSTKAVQRTQVATSVLSADTDALTGESKEMQSAQQKLISLENTRAAAWADKSSAALAETKQMSSESHNGAKSTLVNVVGTSQDVNSELNSGNDQVLALKDKYSTATAEALKQSAAYLATRTKELNNQASATDGAVSNSADILKKTMQSQHDELEKKHDGLKKDIQGASADLKKGADKAVDDTTEAEADSVSYVMQEIERDTGIAPAKKSYTYPDEFVETDPYGEILKPHAKDWEREVSIQTGKIQAGQGPDFSGSLGETDVSGIVENTADAPRPQEIAQCMDDAGWQSSTEDYVITDDGPEGETNSPVLVTVDEEAEEGAAAEGANGADRPSSIGATKLSV
eukprot:m.432117 g.432117  ORF g.432117 m.432117 type:complete len:1136 (-) comp17393_c0_seq1:46-3453(-)